MTISILAVGDVAACRSDPRTIFRACTDELSAGDLCFAQLEAPITDRGAKSPNARLAMRCPPAMAAAARAAGIEVVSCAGNHCLDFGLEGLTDTLDWTSRAGLQSCGAGLSLADARKPAIAIRGGLRIAFLAYSSILPEGYRAERARPGVAAMRAHTVYEQLEPDQPGTAARVITFPHAEDLSSLTHDVQEARQKADLVFVSLHWGLHMVEATIADYQPIVARAAIDAGAHAIFGHHPHLLKGVDFYRGAPIFYSLGNFAIDLPHCFDPEIRNSDSYRHFASLNPGFQSDHIYTLPEDTRLTGIARLDCSGLGVERTEFLPAWILDDSAPQVLSSGDERFARVADYLRRVSRAAGFGTRVETRGDVLSLTPQ